MTPDPSLLNRNEKSFRHAKTSHALECGGRSRRFAFLHAETAPHHKPPKALSSKTTTVIPNGVRGVRNLSSIAPTRQSPQLRRCPTRSPLQ
jgi:hypothetical protein